MENRLFFSHYSLILLTGVCWYRMVGSRVQITESPTSHLCEVQGKSPAFFCPISLSYMPHHTEQWQFPRLFPVSTVGWYLHPTDKGHLYVYPSSSIENLVKLAISITSAMCSIILISPHSLLDLLIKNDLRQFATSVVCMWTKPHFYLQFLSSELLQGVAQMNIIGQAPQYLNGLESDTEFVLMYPNFRFCSRLYDSPEKCMLQGLIYLWLVWI